MIDELEAAWAAGFFDGEGHTRCHTQTQGGYHSLLVMISQVDRRPLDRFVKAVGVGNIRELVRSAKFAKPGVTYYEIRWWSNQAKQVLDIMWPYLSEPKKEQALGTEIYEPQPDRWRFDR